MRKANSRTVVKGFVYGVGLLAAVLFLSRTLRTTTATSPHLRSKQPVSEVASGTAKEKGSAARPVQAAPGDAALTRYQVIIGRNIFAPPAPKQTADAGKLPDFNRKLFTPPIIIPPHGPAVEPPPQVAPLTGWSYVGYYALNGLKKGVLQNDNNDSAKDLAVGEDFLGYKVRSISGEEIVLAAGSAMPVTLKRPLDFPVVPLQGLTAQPGQPAPGQGPRPGRPMRGAGG